LIIGTISQRLSKHSWLFRTHKRGMGQLSFVVKKRQIIFDEGIIPQTGNQTK
jgi:hypothetical protein